MLRTFAMLGAIGLASCHVAPAQTYQQLCIAHGFRPGTSDYLGCLDFMSRDAQRRERNTEYWTNQIVQSLQPPRRNLCVGVGGWMVYCQ
jgi:hypothetical protein